MSRKKMKSECRRTHTSISFTRGMLERIEKITEQMRGHPSRSGYICEALEVALHEDEKRLGIV